MSFRHLQTGKDSILEFYYFVRVDLQRFLLVLYLESVELVWTSESLRGIVDQDIQMLYILFHKFD